MLQKLVTDYIGVDIGEKVKISLDFSSFFGTDQALIKVFALMVSQIDGMTIDFETRELIADYG